MRRLSRACLLATVPAFILAGCSATTPGSSGLRVVAAENFWGSIAAQLAGAKATVRSVITNPNQDPHSYEPTAADARTLATARLVIVNGLGYDPWAPRLLSANPAPDRAVLTVGQALGLAPGDNPHRWYDPANVKAISGAITSELIRLDRKDASYYRARLASFQTIGLSRYHQLIASIRARYAGVPVGASESIFALQAPALGLRLITPPGLMKAVSEGTDVTAQDATAADAQLANRRVAVWVYNSQNQTPEVQRLNALTRSHGIPIVTITESLTPPNATFQQWQVGQLERLAGALREATGR